MAVTAQK